LTTLLCIKEKDHLLFDEIVSGKFERVDQSGEKTKRIYLNDFFETYIPERFHHLQLEMNFEPTEIAPTLQISSVSSNIPNE
ncbi:NTPase KAP, partial [Vibrio sp. Vb2880]|nr:NTPase KAP [Vibrio sp. Vb2880]